MSPGEKLWVSVGLNTFKPVSLLQGLSDFETLIYTVNLHEEEGISQCIWFDFFSWRTESDVVEFTHHPCQPLYPLYSSIVEVGKSKIFISSLFWLPGIPKWQAWSIWCRQKSGGALPSPPFPASLPAYNKDVMLEEWQPLNTLLRMAEQTDGRSLFS